jgi:hypothetical protein
MDWKRISVGVSAMLKLVKREFGLSGNSEIRGPFSLKFNIKAVLIAIPIFVTFCATIFLLWNQNGLFHYLGLLSK